MTAAEIAAHLRSLRNERNIAGQRRFGITSAREQLGISVPVLRAIARAHRRNHTLAAELWGAEAKSNDRIYLDLWDSYLDPAQGNPIQA